MSRKLRRGSEKKEILCWCFHCAISFELSRKKAQFIKIYSVFFFSSSRILRMCAQVNVSLPFAVCRARVNTWKVFFSSPDIWLNKVKLKKNYLCHWAIGNFHLRQALFCFGRGKKDEIILWLSTLSSHSIPLSKTPPKNKLFEPFKKCAIK